MIDIAFVKSLAIASIVEEKTTSNSNVFVDFAEQLLINGIKSDNVEILVSLMDSSYFDKKLYFEKILNDLKIEIENTDEIYVIYAKDIAMHVLRNELDPKLAIRKMDKLYLKIDSKPFFYDAISISDGIDLLDEGYELVQGMTKNNVAQYVRHFFELFLIFEDLNIPNDLLKQAYCKKCKARNIPIIRKYRSSLFTSKNISKNTCPNCKSDDLVYIRYNEGKDLYLHELGL